MFLRFIASATVVLSLMVGCGGDDGDSSAPLPPMIDSFGQTVPEAFASGGDGGAAGGDGTAGDGAPIVNAAVKVTDSAGHSVSTTTDAQGYYRVRIDGFVPPMIASVVRANGSIWYSPSVAPIKVRGFITMNMTGLTDKVASDVAVAAGQSGAAQLTPALLASNTAALQTAKTNLNTTIAKQITAAGLNQATFDPVTLPFRPDLTGYDKILESVAITKTGSGPTQIVTSFALGGTIAGLGASSGLTLANGTDTLTVAPNSTSFKFSKLVDAASTYAVTVTSQPAGLTCSVANASGTMAKADRLNVAVTCSGVAVTVGGSLTGHALITSGLILAAGGQTVTVPANATTYTFPSPFAAGTQIDIQVQHQPADPIRCQSSGVSTVPSQNTTSMNILCDASPIFVTATGLSAIAAQPATSSIVLDWTLNGQHQTPITLPVVGSTVHAFAGFIDSTSSSYAFAVASAPSGYSCTVTNGSGFTQSGAVKDVTVNCARSG